MKQPAHTITLEPWNALSFGERFALEAASIVLWPLPSDQRMTALITLLAAEIDDIAVNEDAVDALLDVIRMKLKMARATDSPPLQSN